MKKENWILMLSIVSIVLSIVAILIWLCEYHPVTWSLLDSCFAVLSAGMTLFVASQVYHSFTLVRKIDEKNAILKKEFEKVVEGKVNEYKKKYEDVMRSYDHNVTALARQMAAIMNYFPIGDYEMALNELMEALNEANLAREHEVEGVANPSNGIISFIKEIENRKPYIVLDLETVDRYKTILAETKMKDAIDLIPYIQSMLAPMNTAMENKDTIKTSNQSIKSPASNP